MNVFVGLGNPGPRYVLSRHNVGFLFVDEFLKNTELIERTKRTAYELFRVSYDDNEILLVKPLKFMNASGFAIKEFLEDYEDIQIKNMHVIYDDLWIPLGKIRIRFQGSDGGHNGVKSIIEQLNTKKFPRIRIGIGPISEEENMVDYVLGEFTDDEINTAFKSIRFAVKAGMDLCKYDMKKVMSHYNGIEVTELDEI
ncbi:MAG: aminoacyl-tRNA hydrolase [Kosmotoga sp.]|nr:MAG: aminoacyl-tRNA hydrolase [Kosmotoga sp.]